MIKAIIFDMNGIIINDEHIHELATRNVLKEIGYALSHQDNSQFFVGKRDAEGFQELARAKNLSFDLNEVLTKKQKVYMQLFPENKKTYPGVIELIKLLAKDFLVAITSSAIRKEIDLVKKEYDLNDNVTVTVSADDVTHGKPDPEPYLVTAKKLKVKPSECVVIEDSPSGIQSAKSAGMYCIGVTTTYDKKFLSHADSIVDNFGEINNLIRSNIINRP